MLTKKDDSTLLTLSRLRAAERAILLGDKSLAIELITTVYDYHEQQYYAKACIKGFKDIPAPNLRMLTLIE